MIREMVFLFKWSPTGRINILLGYYLSTVGNLPGIGYIEKMARKEVVERLLFK